MEAEKLETAKQYWYVTHKNYECVPVIFMNKVDGRKAYRFVYNYRKKKLILSERELGSVYSSLNPARCRLIELLQTKAYGLQQQMQWEQTIIHTPIVGVDWGAIARVVGI